MKNIYIENEDIYEYEDIYWGPQRIMKEEKRIGKVFANYSDILFFGTDNKGNLNIYIFNNNTLNVYYHFTISNIIGVIKLKNGDWRLGIGDWGLGIGDWAQSPIPNPQSPIPNPPENKIL